MVGIELWRFGLRYEADKDPVFDDLNLCIDPGQWSVIVGASGCGKTSLLRALAGLLDQQTKCDGQIRTDDGLPLLGRVAYMAQQDLLLPWLSVLDNVCVAERFAPVGDSQRDLRQRATQLLQQVGLGKLVNAYPQQLSGGQRQRVALARTLMQDRPVVLMDEPFSALDAVTRHRLQNLAAQLLANKTVVLITHDPQEALRLADRLYVLQGRPAMPVALKLPSTAAPRVLDGELAALQQQILQQLQPEAVDELV